MQVYTIKCLGEGICRYCRMSVRSRACVRACVRTRMNVYACVCACVQHTRVLVCMPIP